MDPNAIQHMLKVQADHEPDILSRANVVGIGVGFKDPSRPQDDEMALVALVKKKKPLSELSSADVVPAQVNGVRTDVIEVGELWANQAPNARFRPTIPAGVSIGHYDDTAGTLGAVVRDRSTGARLLLSNNHVFARSNDAEIGDAILQPGPIDGGQNPADRVATLERFIPLRFVEDGGSTPDPDPKPDPTPDSEAPGCVSLFITLTNIIAALTGSAQRAALAPSAQAASAQRVTAPTMPAPVQTPASALLRAQAVDNAMDVALARPVDPEAFSAEILNVGYVSGTRAPGLGMRVRKQGRTTGLTDGMVTLLNATINVGYNTGQGPRTARFSGQVITEPISQGGDSGSLVLDAESGHAVGLLFAGSSLASIFTPIDAVLAALDVSF